jgi:hypothetical protein
MKYMLLLYGSEEREMEPAELDAIMDEYWAYNDMLREKGHLIAGEALQPTATATTVRVRNGATQTADGPFAETKEQLGGFYFLEAKDLDEAIALAARVPDARNGSIEVRPIMEFERPQD